MQPYLCLPHADCTAHLLEGLKQQLVVHVDGWVRQSRCNSAYRCQGRLVLGRSRVGGVVSNAACECCLLSDVQTLGHGLHLLQSVGSTHVHGGS